MTALMNKDIAASNTLFDSIQKVLSELKKELADPDNQIVVSAGGWEHQIKFNDCCQIFNSRFQEKPWVIVYCRSQQDVQITYKLATEHELPIRIRAGGHDHEGECTGTNTILIDVSQMDWVEVDEDTLVASIGPGNRFERLTTKLADKDVMIAHGTCATVGIAGFIMGGGWGPWTRKQGMCCEHLVGANIVLGDGSVVSVDLQDDGIPLLLWALRGGGGMSYGLVTEFRIQTFELPEILLRFSLEWNPYKDDLGDEPASIYPTIEVLKDWEAVIQSDETPGLIGTNLKINGKPALNNNPFNPNTVTHNCVMYGYWEGDEASLKAFIDQWFQTVPGYELKINSEHGGTSADHHYGDHLMNDWHRESYYKILAAKNRQGDLGDTPLAPLLEGKPLPLNDDDDDDDSNKPAPHKLTSRLVEKQGLGEAGYAAFLESLTSELILEGNRDLGLFTYVTLGAIVGDYYRNYPDGGIGGSAFPYKDNLYTIQYQTWWNETSKQKDLEQDNPVYTRTNRAMDWIEVARDYKIPNTSGAFISFKDSSIPTRTYFAQNYDKLVSIKEDCSKDPCNHFRIRKSII